MGPLNSIFAIGSSLSADPTDSTSALHSSRVDGRFVVSQTPLGEGQLYLINCPREISAVGADFVRNPVNDEHQAYHLRTGTFIAALVTDGQVVLFNPPGLERRAENTSRYNFENCILSTDEARLQDYVACVLNIEQPNSLTWGNLQLREETHEFGVLRDRCFYTSDSFRSRIDPMLEQPAPPRDPVMAKLVHSIESFLPLACPIANEDSKEGLSPSEQWLANGQSAVERVRGPLGRYHAAVQELRPKLSVARSELVAVENSLQARALLVRAHGNDDVAKNMEKVASAIGVVVLVNDVLHIPSVAANCAGEIVEGVAAIFEPASALSHAVTTFSAIKAAHEYGERVKELVESSSAFLGIDRKEVSGFLSNMKSFVNKAVDGIGLVSIREKVSMGVSVVKFALTPVRHCLVAMQKGVNGAASDLAAAAKDEISRYTPFLLNSSPDAEGDLRILDEKLNRYTDLLASGPKFKFEAHAFTPPAAVDVGVLAAEKIPAKLSPQLSSRQRPRI